MTDERKLKYLGINLTKDMRFFCDEKYKTLSNTIEKNTENEKKTSIFMGWHNYYQNVHTTESSFTDSLQT